MIKAGYTEGTARSTASDYFKRSRIRKELDRRMAEAVERNALSEDWIVQRLMAIADATLYDLFEKDENGELVLDDEGLPHYVLNQMNSQLKRALNSFSIRKYMQGRGKDAKPVTEVKVTLQDQLRALEMLGKYLGMFKEKVEISGSEQMMERYNEARRRVREGEFHRGNTDRQSDGEGISHTEPSALGRSRPVDGALADEGG